MPRSVQKLATLVRAYFTVYNALDVPVTALPNGAFGKLLSFNGAPSAVPVTVTEIDAATRPGQYFASFTPSGVGQWYLLITNAANNPRGWDEEFDVTTDGVFTIDDVFIKADMVETGWNLRDTLRVNSAVLCGKVSGGPGHPVFTNLQQTAPRVDSVADANGNRTTVTLTP